MKVEHFHGKNNAGNNFFNSTCRNEEPRLLLENVIFLSPKTYRKFKFSVGSKPETDKNTIYIERKIISSVADLQVLTSWLVQALLPRYE